MTANNPHNLVVGQRLWLVPTTTHAREILVTSTGRVWAKISSENDHARLNMRTLEIDYKKRFPFGKVYLSSSEFETHQARSQEWFALIYALQKAHHIPCDVGLDSIRSAAKLLGVSLDRPTAL